MAEKGKSKMSSIPYLPAEIVSEICSYLSIQDRKKLRLVARMFSYHISLNVSRVFISPSKRNLEVFKGVASHPIFRHQVREIIWDDARFPRYLAEEESKTQGRMPWDPENPKIAWNDAIYAASYSTFVTEWWKNREYAQINDGLKKDSSDEVSEEEYEEDLEEDSQGDEQDGPENKLLSLEESFALYQKLYVEQEAIIASGEDVESLRFGFEMFPSLNRIKITIDTYGPCYSMPRYQTPLIRSFPSGFNFPTPISWLGGKDTHYWPMDIEPSTSWAEVRHHFHGYCVVTSEIIRAYEVGQSAISEFVIERGNILGGVLWKLFDEPDSDIEALRKIFAMPGLKHLDFSVNFQSKIGRGDEVPDYIAVKKALSSLTYIEVLHFHSNFYFDKTIWRIPMSLVAVLPNPASSWPRLQCLQLSNLSAEVHEMIHFLSLLPRSLRLIEFKNIDVGDDWAQVLEEMRDTLGWRGNRPTIFYEETREWPSKGDLVVHEEMAAFLDGRFPNVFDRVGVKFGVGRLKCSFDDSYDKPNRRRRVSWMGGRPRKLLMLEDDRKRRPSPV